MNQLLINRIANRFLAEFRNKVGQLSCHLAMSWSSWGAVTLKTPHSTKPNCLLSRIGLRRKRGQTEHQVYPLLQRDSAEPRLIWPICRQSWDSKHFRISWGQSNPFESCRSSVRLRCRAKHGIVLQFKMSVVGYINHQLQHVGGAALRHWQLLIYGWTT